MIDNKINLFVGGVHGVGKTTCCRELSAITGIRHFTASDIIKQERTFTQALSTKRVADVDGNQAALVNGVKRLMVDEGQKQVILDGHFSIVDSSGNINTISKNVFMALAIKGIIILHDDPESIASRLRSRDINMYEGYDVSSHQNIEMEHGRTVAAALSVPISFVRAFDIKLFTDTAMGMIR